MAHGPKYFFFHAPRRFGQFSKDRRLHVESVVQRIAEFWHAAPGDDGRSFFSSEAVVGKNFFTMLFRNQGSHLGGLVQRKPRAQALRFSLEGLNEPVKDRSLHIHALRTKAYLSSIEEYGVSDSTYSLVKVAISKNDRGILPAQFKRYRLHGRRDIFHDGRSGLRLSRKGDRVHIRMLGQELASRLRTESVDHVVDTVRNSGFSHHLRKQSRRSRSFFRRLHHNGITTRQRWRHFPSQQKKRKIPRSDDSDYTQRITDCIVQGGLAVRRF